MQSQAQKATQVQLLPDIDWVDIPAGDFIYGEKDTQQTLYLDAFRIARYPVTNTQYQAFIDADGYEDERWWHDLKKPQPEASEWPQGNRPRTNVDWYEAMAFCRWLSAQLDYDITLPTEQQWEKAARGTDGRQYPWGSEYQVGYANVDESTLNGQYMKQTTAVGLFPHGRSPFGAEDMAGNVWDWCSTKYDKPEENSADDSGDVRVLRGGSWGGDPEVARTAFRDWLLPDSRNSSFGFRLSCSLPFSDR